MPDAYGDATMIEWLEDGKPVPPPHIYKEVRVREVAKRLSIRRFMETGYGWGRMIRAIAKDFDEIMTIERDDKLYQKAFEEFADAGHVRLFRGDSSTLLPAIILELDGPCLFWLDAHGEDGSPVISELRSVLSRGKVGDRDAVMIDDLRCFGVEPGWPSLEEVCATINEYRPDWTVRIESDVLTTHGPTNGD